MVTKKIPIEALIKELQKAAEANPGIMCMAWDNDACMAAPHLQVERVVEAGEYGTYIVTPEKHAMNLRTLEFYAENSNEFLWQETDEETRVMLYDGKFEVMVKQNNLALEMIKKDIENYENASLHLVISSR